MKQETAIDKKIMNYVKYQVGGLNGKFGLVKEDIEDIENEIYVEILEKAFDNFNGESSYLTFIHGVVDRKIKHIIRSRHFQKRDYLKCQTYLSDPITNSEGQSDELVNVLCSDKKSNTTYSDIKNRNSEDLKIDILEVVRKLPQEYQKIVQTLKDYRKVDAAKKLGISRDQLYRKTQFIKKFFENSGINCEYLKS